jgi:hypothetical protein
MFGEGKKGITRKVFKPANIEIGIYQTIINQGSALLQISSGLRSLDAIH